VGGYQCHFLYWFHDGFQTNVAASKALVLVVVQAAVVALQMAALAIVSSIVRHEATVAAAEVRSVIYARCCFNQTLYSGAAH
jgi:hypothetical protein